MAVAVKNVLLFLGLLMFGLVVSQYERNNEVDPAVKQVDDVMMMDSPTVLNCDGNDTCTDFACDYCALFYFDHNAIFTLHLPGGCTPCPAGYWCKYHSYNLASCYIRAKCAPQEVEPANITDDDRYRNSNAYLIPMEELQEHADNLRIRHCLHYRRHRD